MEVALREDKFNIRGAEVHAVGGVVVVSLV